MNFYVFLSWENYGSFSIGPKQWILQSMWTYIQLIKNLCLKFYLLVLPTPTTSSCHNFVYIMPENSCDISKSLLVMIRLSFRCNIQDSEWYDVVYYLNSKYQFIRIIERWWEREPLDYWFTLLFLMDIKKT